MGQCGCCLRLLVDIFVIFQHGSPLETRVCDVFSFPKFCLAASQQHANAWGVEIYQMCCFKFPVTSVGDPTAAAPSGCLPRVGVFAQASVSTGVIFRPAMSPSLDFWLTDALTQSIYIHHFGNNNSLLLPLGAHWIVTTFLYLAAIPEFGMGWEYFRWVLLGYSGSACKHLGGIHWALTHKGVTSFHFLFMWCISTFQMALMCSWLYCAL